MPSTGDGLSEALGEPEPPVGVALADESAGEAEESGGEAEESGGEADTVGLPRLGLGVGASGAEV